MGTVCQEGGDRPPLFTWWHTCPARAGGTSAPQACDADAARTGSPPAPSVSRLGGFGVVVGAHGGDFGGGHMPAPGFAMRVGGAEGRFVWFQMRPLGARAPGALPPTVTGTLWALRAWLYAVYSNPQLLPAHIPEPR